MSNKVQFVTGLLSGLVLPAITWLVFDVLCKSWVLFNKPAIPYLVSVCVNLFVMRYLVKHDKENAAYGIMVTSFIVMWTVFKYKM
jgi:hypothetical protein